MNILYVAGGVAITCCILYILDRKAREEPIEWSTAMKFLVLGGLLGGGVTFAVASPDIPISTTLPEVSTVQDMFVGVPTF
jgi:hypothetical protein